MDVVAAVRAALVPDRRVTGLELAGSRTAGRAHARSDWDFAVRTDDFASLRVALPGLVAPLDPLASQWDRYSDTACYMLLLRGPTKVDLIFPDEPQEWAPPWRAGPETLGAIDAHFWDWALWLDQKAHGPRADSLGQELARLHELLLAPLGVAAVPASVPAAVAQYLVARARLERAFGTTVPRRLEAEVRPVVAPQPRAGSRRPGA